MFFQTSLSLLKIWCNPAKLLHYYFQTVFNMFRIWCNQNIVLHHYFKQFWTCLKYDAIKTNYCITFINAFKTSFYLFKRWCNQKKYCIPYARHYNPLLISNHSPHWSKLTLIPFLILRTFDHSSRWEMIKEF